MSIIIWLIIAIIIILLLIYIKLEIVIQLIEEQDNKALTIELIPVFKRFKKEYKYSDLDIKILDLIPFLSLKTETEDYRGKPNVEKESNKELKEILNINKSLKAIIQSIRNKKNIAKKIISYLVIDKIIWKTTIGFNDAMYTAISTGAMWGIKGFIISLLSSASPLKEINIEVKPDFTKSNLNTYLNCIFKIRIVHIIIIIFYVFGIKVRGYINGARTTTKPSH